MRIVVQRVLKASVTISDHIHSAIDSGLLILVGIEDADGDEDINWLTNKIVNLRIFNDEHGIPNLSVKETGGNILLVSQFTLHASTKKGNRPGYSRASKSDHAIPLYEKLILAIESLLEKKIQTGIFGTDMQVELVNDGPVTIIIDSRNRE